MGRDINMDVLDHIVGPSKDDRERSVAENPYIAALAFHFLVDTMLDTICGIRTSKEKIHRRKGILGEVEAYFGVIEAQGRGTLHLHMIMWLSNSPTSVQMGEMLKSELFRAKVVAFIDANIRASLDGYSVEMVRNIPKEAELAFRRPPQTGQADFGEQFRELERRIVRSQQVHTCKKTTCLRWSEVRKKYTCKRRAPFALSDTTYIEENGNWLPKRIHPMLNNWNPYLAVAGRMNHDIKLMTNGNETKDCGWYMTKYASKDQRKTHNLSAIVTKGLIYHKERTNPLTAEILNANRLLLFRCFQALNRAMEYSGPQVHSYLMGRGDHVCSHDYVPMYWSSVASSLRRHFPEFGAAAFL
jgi:hypothetical protein